MTRSEATVMIIEEVDRATKKHTKWPVDPIHAAAIVVEEAGELQQAALQYTYEDGLRNKMMTEAIHAAATAVRFLVHFDKMKPSPNRK